MSSSESLIDPAEFGLIADYLRNPQCSIDYLLHVRSIKSLAPLAEALAQRAQMDQPPWMFPKVVERGLAAGSLRLSAHDLDFRSKRVVDARSVPRHAMCHVIYAPPFYLVHTPGLFEGTLLRPKTEQSPGHELHQQRAARRKV